MQHHPLARQDQTRHHLLRDVCHYGFLSDVRRPHRRKDADRPTDGVDQTDVLLGKSETGARESMLTFIGLDLVAVRLKQWRTYFKGGSGPDGFPSLYNIEMDPHEDLNVFGLYTWEIVNALEPVAKYKETLKKYSNPPASTMTKF